MAQEINNFVGDEFLQYLYVVDSTYTITAIIDSFTDVLWTERYCGCGEFEITMPMRYDIFEKCRLDDYIVIRESDVVMIIETIGIHSDYENGDTLTISGRSLESLLERRIIIDETIGKVSTEGEASPVGVQEAIRTMVNNNVAAPSNSYRTIPKFSFSASTDSRITSLSMESFQERGTNLYDKILAICKDKDLGFRVNALDGGGYQFELYFGTDRTWDQTAVPVVVFSESYENLLNTDYLRTDKEFKSAIYVEWDWNYKKGSNRDDPQDKSNAYEYTGTDVTESYRGSNPSGLARRETFIKADKSYDLGFLPYGSTIPIDNLKRSYITQMQDKGREDLANYKTTEYFDGETNPNRQYIYGRDYVLGDVVQLENKYGRKAKCRITEIIRSRNASGPSMVPTFEKVEGDD